MHHKIIKKAPWTKATHIAGYRRRWLPIKSSNQDDDGPHTYVTLHHTACNRRRNHARLSMSWSSRASTTVRRRRTWSSGKHGT